MIKTMTPTEYAGLVNMSASGVCKAIKRGSKLPFVVDVQKHSRFFLLSVKVTDKGLLPTLKNKVKK